MKKYIITLIIGLLLTAEVVAGATILFPYQGGTGTGTVPTVTQLLIGTAGGVYAPQTMSGDVTIAAGGATTIGANKILESMLKAVDAAGDEECLTYEATVGDFEWQACGGAGGDITDVGPGCATGACWTDGLATAGTVLLIWEGTTADGNELSIIVPADPGADIDITMPASTGTLALTTDNVATATALAANPGDCGANQFANTIAANGDLTCAAIGDADVPDNITISLAATATALAADPADCGANQFANAINASGTLTCAAFSDADIPNDITINSSAVITSAVGIDAIGNVDFDIGSVDVDDITLITDGGTWVFEAGLVFPDSNFTPNIAAQVVYDNTVAGIDDGWFAWYDDDEVKYFLDINTVPTDAEDDYVVAYDKDIDKLYWKIDANSGGSTAYDDIADPDAASIIVFDDGEYIDYQSAEDTGVVMYIKSTDADLAGDTTLLYLGFQQATDANQIYFQCKDNLVDVPAVVFQIGVDGNTTIGGTLNVTGAITGSLSGNASTASALFGDPTDCGANNFAQSIAANGNLTCAGIGDADVPNDITINLATLASTVTVVDTEDYTAYVALFDDASGSLAAKTDEELTYDASTGILTATGFAGPLTGAVTGNASTATALAGDPADCAANNYAYAINASGTLTCSTIDISSSTNLAAGRSLTMSGDSVEADAELYTDTKCIFWENPLATDDFKSIWFAKQATTITSLWCESDQTVTAMLQVDDGSPADVDSVDLTCDSSPPEDTSLDGDATLASGDRLDVDVASVAGTPTWVSICWTFTYDD